MPTKEDDINRKIQIVKEILDNVYEVLTLFKPLMNKMMKSGPKKLSPSRFNFFGIGGWLMRREMAIKKMQSIPEKMEDAKELDVKFFVCDQFMNMMGLKREDLINDVEKVVGVGTYTKEVSESQVNLVF